LIVTNWGERVVHYDFGANLRPIIFEQISDDTEQKVQDAISSAIEKWMPFVTILNMRVFTSATDNTVGDNEIRVKINFSVGSTDMAGELEVRVAS
jgi:phage baseplate assembly protein W